MNYGIQYVPHLSRDHLLLSHCPQTVPRPFWFSVSARHADTNANYRSHPSLAQRKCGDLSLSSARRFSGYRSLARIGPVIIADNGMRFETLDFMRLRRQTYSPAEGLQQPEVALLKGARTGGVTLIGGLLGAGASVLIDPTLTTAAILATLASGAAAASVDAAAEAAEGSTSGAKQAARAHYVAVFR